MWGTMLPKVDKEKDDYVLILFPNLIVLNCQEIDLGLGYHFPS